MKKYHQVESVRFEKSSIHLIVDSKSIKRELKDISPLLATAKEEELKEFEISPAGYGIHWPSLDEDISIDGLLGVVHKPSANRKSA